LALVNQKIFKFINNSSKYNIQDEKLKESLSIILDSFLRIEVFYNNFLFKNPEFDMNSRTIDNTELKFASEKMSIDNTEKSVKNHQNGNKIDNNSNNKSYNNLNIINKESQKLMYSSLTSSNTSINEKKMNETIGDISFNISTDSINVNSYRNAILSDYIKTLKIGYLIPVDCGHNGTYNQAELDLFSFYLLNSNLLN